MGYTTDFAGTLMFAATVTVAELRELKKWLGCDSREVEPELEQSWYYMQFELTDAMDGIRWDGSEKFYGAVEAVNWLVAKVREQFPAFVLTGQLTAQGEDTKDRWRLVIKEGVAVKVDNPPNGTEVECPDCGCGFMVDGISGKII